MNSNTNFFNDIVALYLVRSLKKKPNSNVSPTNGLGARLSVVELLFP